jgi:hypothetical protein
MPPGCKQEETNMSIDGKWNVTVNSPMGAQKSEITLKTDGATLTGSGSGPGGATTAITDGKADGNKVFWKVAVTSPMPMTLEFTGAVEGDGISGNVKAGMFGSFPFTGTRG